MNAIEKKVIQFSLNYSQAKQDIRLKLPNRTWECVTPKYLLQRHIYIPFLLQNHDKLE